MPAKKKTVKKKTTARRKTTRTKAKPRATAKARTRTTAKKKTAKKKTTTRAKTRAKATTRKKTTTRKKATAKAKPRAKATARKKTTTGKKRKPNAAFMKPMKPSAALSAIVGKKPLPRTQVTKKLWAYIKRNKLQDAKVRTQIIADAKLKPIFGRKRSVSMFQMTALVSKHLS